MQNNDILGIIDELKEHAVLLELENMRLKIQNERKDKTIQQLVELCNKWYGELKQYEPDTDMNWQRRW